MANEEFKISLGVELASDASADLNKQIDALQVNPIKLEFDDKDVKSQLDDIKEQIEDIRELARKKIDLGIDTTKSSDISKIMGEIGKQSNAVANTVVQAEKRKQRAINETNKLISDSAKQSIKNVSSKGSAFKIDKGDSDAFKKEMDALVKEWTNGEGNVVDLKIKTKTSYDKDADANIEELVNAQVTYNNAVGETITKTIAWRKIAEEIGADGKANPVMGFAEVTGQYQKTLGETTAQTDNFVKKQKKAVADLKNQINQLNGSATDKNASKPIKIDTHLKDLANKYDEITAAIQRMETASSDTFIDEEINVKRLISEFKILVSEYRNAENVQPKLKGVDFKSGLDIAKNDLAKFKAEAKDFAQVNQTIANLDDAINKVNDTSSLNDFINQLRVAKSELGKVKAETKNTKLEASKTSLSSDIDVWLKRNSAAADGFGDRLKDIQKRLIECDQIEFNELKAEFKEIKKEAEITGKTGLTFFDGLKNKLEKYGMYLSAAEMVSYVKRALESMYEQIVEIDTAMTDLKKVTDETDASYERFLTNANKKAKELGRSVSSFVQQSANWAKMGYDTSESAELAKVSSIYSNVADVDDATAVSDIVTAMKAFNIEAENAITIIDPLNKISNEFAVTASGLGQGLSRAASTMAASGTDLEHTLALLTGISEITQSPEEAGNFLKTAIARIQGMKGKLEELGEEVDESVDSISKVQTQILNLTHGKVDIFDDDDNFRDYYEIMKDISDIVDELKSTDRAQLYEILFGKNRMNQGAAMIQAFQSGQIDKALEAALGSDGSAMAEQEKWMESLEAKLGQLQAAWQDLSQSFLSSDFLKNIIDALIKLVEVLDWVVEHIGTLGVLLAGFNTVNIGKNFIKYRKEVDSLVSILDVLRLSFPRISDGVDIFTAALANGAKGAGLLKAGISGVWAVLSKHPIILVITALAGLAFAFDKVIITAEKANEAMDKTFGEYEDAKQKASELNNELKTAQERLEELESKDGLSFIEQDELDKLRESTELLKIQADLAEKDEQKKAVEAGNAAVEAYKKNFQYDISEERTEKYKNDEDMFGESLTLFGDESDISAMIAGIKQYTKLRDDLDKNSSSYAKNYQVYSLH